ncbi:MAG: ribonuclease [Lachnospiraceae bacterium]|nr:ribonuclease [Lachnospiraceae bacterium]
MKKRRLNFYILITFLAVLLLGGCQKTFNFDSDNSTIVPDGIKINYESDVEFNINDGSNSVIAEVEDSDEESDIKEEEAADSKTNDDNSDSDSANTNANDLDEDDTDANINSDLVDVDSNDAGLTESNSTEGDTVSDISVSEDGEYTSKEEVALYIHLYNHLPSNFITKNEAKDLGWDSGAGNLNKVAPGKSIGGDKFGNREGLLPKKDKRVYYECDIDYVKGKRNGKRIVFSNDGLVYYTEDHYQTFELLYE